LRIGDKGLGERVSCASQNDALQKRNPNRKRSEFHRMKRLSNWGAEDRVGCSGEEGRGEVYLGDKGV